ncbi:LOW QUALITY PROTEIN: hypothetical protein HID58_072663, partial [Brassica napus]
VEVVMRRWFYGDGAYGISEERRSISGNHKPDGMEKVAIEQVAAEKLMEMVMEVVVTKDVDIVYNYT